MLTCQWFHWNLRRWCFYKLQVWAAWSVSKNNSLYCQLRSQVFFVKETVQTANLKWQQWLVLLFFFPKKLRCKQMSHWTHLLLGQLLWEQTHSNIYNLLLQSALDHFQQALYIFQNLMDWTIILNANFIGQNFSLLLGGLHHSVDMAPFVIAPRLHFGKEGCSGLWFWNSVTQLDPTAQLWDLVFAIHLGYEYHRVDDSEELHSSQQTWAPVRWRSKQGVELQQGLANAFIAKFSKAVDKEKPVPIHEQAFIRQGRHWRRGEQKGGAAKTYFETNSGWQWFATQSANSSHCDFQRYHLISSKMIGFPRYQKRPVPIETAQLRRRCHFAAPTQVFQMCWPSTQLYLPVSLIPWCSGQRKRTWGYNMTKWFPRERSQK